MRGFYGVFLWTKQGPRNKVLSSATDAHLHIILVSLVRNATIKIRTPEISKELSTYSLKNKKK
jgi:hypothetical protein